MAEASVGTAEGTLTEHNCAIPAVAERFPEICAAEARFLADVLGARGGSPSAHADRLQRLRVPRAVQAPLRRTHELVGRDPGQQGIQVRLRHRHRVGHRRPG